MAANVRSYVANIWERGAAIPNTPDDQWWQADHNEIHAVGTSPGEALERLIARIEDHRAAIAKRVASTKS